MTALATICIPIAPYHLDTAQRAIDSARKQTVVVDILTYTDDEPMTYTRALPNPAAATYP